MRETKLLCVDIDIDKRGIVALLNRDDSYTKVLRTWEFTPKGGLKELANKPVLFDDEPVPAETMDRAASAVARQMAKAMATGNGAVRVTATEQDFEVTEEDPYGLGPIPDMTSTAQAPEGVNQADYDRTRAEIDARDAKRKSTFKGFQKDPGA